MRYFVLFLLLSSGHFLSAQSPAPNAVYAELLGDAILYSVNYERTVLSMGNSAGAVRLGFAYTFLELIDDSEGVTIPIELLGRLGNRHHLEYGLGSTFQTLDITDNSILGPPVEYSVTRLYLTARLGYRFQAPEGGFVFRAGFTPLFLLSERNDDPTPADPTNFIPLGGLSFGYAF